ncbi:MAG TPA: glycosyltransferase [Candidatus Paceibacterota bacterium]|nr:glycosyltransferase [Candidatus Paceibacterota bacterium]
MKISIVTPAYNMEKFISHTIESVLRQRGDFDLEYIVVNDGSTDKTEEIIKGYQNKLDSKELKPLCSSLSLKYHYQTNKGMYAAINKGFSLATGEIFAWLGGDDLYSPDTSLDTVATWFTKNPTGLWLKGICSFIDEQGKEIKKGVLKTYNRDWLQKGIYGRETYFVEQESTFWRKELWDKVSPIPENLRSAGDYWLGIQFAKHAQLHSIPAHVTYFRIRPGQISSQNTKYRDEQKIIMPKRSMTAYKMRVLSILYNKLRITNPLKYILFKCMFPTKKPF